MTLNKTLAPPYIISIGSPIISTGCNMLPQVEFAMFLEGMHEGRLNFIPSGVLHVCDLWFCDKSNVESMYVYQCVSEINMVTSAHTL